MGPRRAARARRPVKISSVFAPLAVMVGRWRVGSPPSRAPSCRRTGLSAPSSTRSLAGVAAPGARGDRHPDPPAARPHRLRVPGRRLEAALHPSAAAWFESDAVREAFGAVLSRPYEPERAGVTEAAIEAGAAVAARATSRTGPAPSAARPPRGAPGPGHRASASGTGIARPRSWPCPVRTPGGRMLGALMVASSAPHRPLSERGPARDRGVRRPRRRSRSSAPSCSPTRRAARRRSGCSTARRRRSAASLELDEVYRAIVAQAARLTGASKVMLAALRARARELRTVASIGVLRARSRARASRSATG